MTDISEVVGRLLVEGRQRPERKRNGSSYYYYLIPTILTYYLPLSTLRYHRYRFKREIDSIAAPQEEKLVASAV